MPRHYHPVYPMNKILLQSLLIICLCLIGNHAYAQSEPTSTTPEQFVEQGDYARAARLYEAQLKQEPSAELYHNLGVCYGLMDKLPASILSYERALLLTPTLREARHNLRLAYSKSPDALSDGRAIPLLDDLGYMCRTNTLIVISLILFGGMLSALIIFRLRHYSLAMRKVAFYSAIGLLLAWLGTNALIAHQWYYDRMARTRAIVITPETLRTQPSEKGDAVTELHPGTATFIEDEALGIWTPVRLADGRHGWIPSAAIEAVAR